MLLLVADLNIKYIIEEILIIDIDTKNFLFTLGFNINEILIVLMKLKNIYIIKIKNVKYAIDIEIIKNIKIKQYIGE